jgi:pimeloyl-ACP methyl ester carboxylesterase
VPTDQVGYNPDQHDEQTEKQWLSSLYFQGAPLVSAKDKATAPPSRLLLLVEGRAVYELASLYLSKPWLRKSPRGDGHPVMVFPGFAASNLSTRPLRRFLRQQGFSSHTWGQGRNLGPRKDLEDRMLERVLQLSHTYGGPVSLVGWSLGGVYARFLAHRAPEQVRTVITLGSPFQDNPKANHSWRLFEWLSGQKIDQVDPATMHQVRTIPPVPTTSIYSRTDGITSWRCCVDPPGPENENIEVRGSHCGLGVNPVVLHAIADRLAQPLNAWRHFKPGGPMRHLYKNPHTNPSAQDIPVHS